MQQLFKNYSLFISKLHLLGYPRRSFQYGSGLGYFWAENTSRNTFFALAFTLGGTLIMALMLFNILFGNAENRLVMLIPALLCAISSVYLLRHFLWMLNGKQLMEIEDGVLRLTKQGTFWTKPQVFELASIDKIRVRPDEKELSFMERMIWNRNLSMRIFFRQTVGEIFFDTGYKTIRVFDDLTVSERNMVLKEILERKVSG